MGRLLTPSWSDTRAYVTRLFLAVPWGWYQQNLEKSTLRATQKMFTEFKLISD